MPAYRLSGRYILSPPFEQLRGYAVGRFQLHGKMMSSEDYARMSDRIGSKTSGIPWGICIWISMRGSSHHCPCIRVSNSRKRFRDPCCDSGGAFAINIIGTPRVIAGIPRNFAAKEIHAIKKWIHLNRSLLLERWQSLYMDTGDFCENIRVFRISKRQR